MLPMMKEKRALLLQHFMGQKHKALLEPGMLSIQTLLSTVDICLPLAQSANLHVGNNWNVLKLLIWRVSVVLAFVITPPAQARELVLAQGSQVDQYLAAVIVAIKAYDRLLGMRQLQALVLNPDTSPMMRQHLLGRIKSIRATYPKFFWSASVENDNRNFATDTMLITLNGQQLPYTVSRNTDYATRNGSTKAIVVVMLKSCVTIRLMVSAGIFHVSSRFFWLTIPFCRS